MYITSIMKNLKYLIVVLSLCCQQYSFSQCATRINTFPYNQNFELNNGNWSSNGAVNWKWGSIVSGTKTIITSAGGGQKCWIVGGLNTSHYNSGVSYLQSPCFDFSSLVNPEISFKVIWETEKNYDGVNLQYSIDEGLTWIILGSTTSNSNCQGTNWYNNSSIRFIGYTNGWSGSVIGSCQVGEGSGQWLVAKHNMSMLSGKNKVIFRFEFGAGTICNDYDGFAFDDVLINETPPISGDFTYSCLENNSVKFVNNPSPCQTNINWNFGDISSGVNNTSTINIPTHTFSSPGTYTITQTINYATGQSSTHNETISILSVSQTITNPILCYGNQNGGIRANVTGGNGVYNYSWNTTQQTQTINNLQPGTYIVTTSSNNSCPASSTITLTQPSQIVLTTSVIKPTCNLSNGSITSNVNGGVNPYSYSWSSSQTTNNITNLSSGNYILTITDNNGCSINSGNIPLVNVNVPVNISLGDDMTICNGNTILLNPGSFSNYLWQDNSTSPTYLVNHTGQFYVMVTNSSGCKGSDTINVIVDCKGIYFPNAFTPNNDGVNDMFGPVGDLNSLRDFKMSIYDRLGQLIFMTYNPLQKWNGKFKSRQIETQGLVWMATYKIYNGNIINKKGFVIILK